MPKKPIILKTLKFKTILFNKYVNKALLAIITKVLYWCSNLKTCITVFIYTKKVWVERGAR